MAKRSLFAKSGIIKSPGKAGKPAIQVYHNPTVAYNPNLGYNPTKGEITSVANAMLANNPSLAQQGTAALRAGAVHILRTYGPSAAQWVGNQAANFVADTAGNIGPVLSGSIKRKFSGDKANTPSDNKVFPGKVNSIANTSYALSPAPNPKPITLNSGLKPNTFVNDYMTPTVNLCSPLHITCSILGIPTFANNPLTGYFTNTICFDIQTRAQEAVGFGLDITNTLSATNLVNAFTAAIQALQCYFWYSSVLSYESDSRNKNSGMMALRARIDATTLSDYYQLGRRLEDTPVPPRVVQWVRYMSGTFLSSNTQGSPLLKICPQPNYFDQALPATSWPLQALNTLNTVNNTAVFALLRRCVPNWRIGKLYDVPAAPMFDKNFLTIWANLPQCNRATGANVIGQQVSNTTTAVPYCSYNNNLDGLAFAMGYMWDSVLNCSYPGLTNTTQVNATYPDNRYSYYTSAGVPAFYPVSTINFLAFCRQETIISLGTTNYYPHLFGTDKCQNVTGAAYLQSGQNTLDYLFNTGSIQVKKRVAQYS